MSAYTFISSSPRFRPSVTGLVVHGEEECGVTAEMTPKMSAV